MDDETSGQPAHMPLPGEPPPGWQPIGAAMPPPPPPGTAMPPPPSSPVPPAAPPGQFQPPPPPIPVETTRWRSLRGLTTALTVVLVLAAVDAVFGIVAYAHRITVINDLIDGRLDFGTVRRAHDADHLVGAAVGIMIFLSIVILVLMIIWMYRAAKNHEALGRPHPRFKPGWAIAGWLIPFANLVIPVLMLQDLWRGSDVSTPRLDSSWRANKGSGLVGWYWAALLLSYVRYGVGRSDARLAVADQLRDVRTHDGSGIFGMVATIAAAILAIQVLRGIVTRQEACLHAQQVAWAAGNPAPPPA